MSTADVSAWDQHEYDRCERVGPGQGKPCPYIKGIWHQIRDEFFYAMGNEILR